jgi:hypothetical protein
LVIGSHIHVFFVKLLLNPLNFPSSLAENKCLNYPHFKFTGKQIPIEHPDMVNRLYPTAVVQNNSYIVANFGTNSVKPFEYDIDKCPGLVFE